MVHDDLEVVPFWNVLGYGKTVEGYRTAVTIEGSDWDDCIRRGTRIDETSTRRLLDIHVGDELMEIVAVHFGDTFVGIAFVLGIEDKVRFVKIGVTRCRRGMMEEMDSTDVVLVARVQEACRRKERIEVLFPKPSTIEEDAVNLVVRGAVFEFFVTKNLEAELLEIAVFGIIRMVYRAQVAIDDLGALLTIIGRRCLLNRFDRILGVGIVLQNSACVGVLTDILDGMANELGEVIVIGVLTRLVSHIAGERQVEADMLRDVYSTAYVGIVVAVGLVLFVETLPVRTFEIREEEIDEEIEDILVGCTILEIEEIDGEHTLKHVMEEIILFVGFGKTREDAQTCVLVSHKAHDVAGDEGVVAFDGEDRRVLDLVGTVAEAMREDEQMGISIQLYISDGHSSNRSELFELLGLELGFTVI